MKVLNHWHKRVKYVDRNIKNYHYHFKETRSVTMNIFRKKEYFFKSFVKTELSYIFTINMVSTAENCKEKGIILLKEVFFLLLVIIHVPPIILDS